MMENYEIAFHGVEELQQTVEKASKLEDVKTLIRYHTANMMRYAAQNAPVLTGFLKQSERIAIEDNGLVGKVYFTAEYAPYQEYGTRWIYGKFYLKFGFDMAAKEYLHDMEVLFG